MSASHGDIIPVRTALGQPPSTKRGAVLTTDARDAGLELGIHWLSGTVPPRAELAVDDVLAFVSLQLEGADWEVLDRGLNGYTSTYRTAFGVRVLTNDSRPEMGIHLIIDGEACEALGYQRLRSIFRGLPLRASRIDLALDNCPFQPRTLKDEWLKDNVRTACKPERNPLPGREGIRKCHWHASPRGDTFYMGSRTSTAFARCYNQRGFTRLELEMKRERADRVAPEVFEGPARLKAIMLGLVRSFADFVDAKCDKNRSRCPLLPFWDAFLAGCARLDVRLEPRPEPTVESLVNWIERQVSASLVIYEQLQSLRVSCSPTEVRQDSVP